LIADDLTRCDGRDLVERDGQWDAVDDDLKDNVVET
jgi:hypothetical protein